MSSAGVEVVSTNPAPGAKDVPLSTCPTGNAGPCGGAFTVTFNNTVDMSTLVLQITPPLLALLVRCPSAGSNEPGCPASVPPNQSAVIMYLGTTSYAPDTTYKVTVVAAKTPEPGAVSLPQSYEWTFTTATM